jgi:hypothetical protein
VHGGRDEVALVRLDGEGDDQHSAR